VNDYVHDIGTTLNRKTNAQILFNQVEAQQKLLTEKSMSDKLKFEKFKARALKRKLNGSGIS
jgi:hypothetical protein